MNREFEDYQLFIGSTVKENIETDFAQIKNTVEGLSYRIPTVISAKDNEGKETIISICDVSESGGDFGRIQLAMRRSTDGGETFNDMQVILSPPACYAPQKGGEYRTSFALDPILCQCDNGDILILVDFFPESRGIMRSKLIEKDTGYINLDGKNYLALHSGKTISETGKHQKKNDVYTVRENGWIFTPDGRKTNYYLPAHHNHEYAFATVGDMYYAKNGGEFLDKCPPLMPENTEDVYVGNIFLSIDKEKFDEKNPKKIKKRFVSPEKTGDEYSKYPCVETKPAPLSAVPTQYLWVLRSSDMGKTWSEPMDITPSVKLLSDGVFVGTGPGVMIKLINQTDEKLNGRIIAPIYNLKKTSLVISDDNGKTWRRGGLTNNIDESQFIETMNGNLFCFGRQKKLGKTPFSLSTDGGETWEKMRANSLSSIKCQKSYITLPMDGENTFRYAESMDKTKQYVLASCSSGNYQKNSKRFGGVVVLGEVTDNTNIKWIAQRRITAKAVKGEKYNFYAYSCLSVLADGNIGLMYEAMPGGCILFRKLDISWIASGEKPFTFNENKPKFLKKRRK